MKITIGDYLLLKLKEIGIKHVIGVPGDFNLQFLDQIEQTKGIKFINTRNELNAAYAADGYARMNGISVLSTTYGVGELSAINGVAGAYAEHVPVVCLTGAPPLYVMEEGRSVHHTMADGNFENMLNVYSEFTVAQARLTPENAELEIDRVLTACLAEKKPVYLQLPSNISHLIIEVNANKESILLNENKSPLSDLNELVTKIVALYQVAQKPAVLVDMDVDRYQVAETLQQIVDKTQLPFAALMTGKAILNENQSLYMGLYNGGGSAKKPKELIEDADFLLSFSPRWVEGNSGAFTTMLPTKNLVNIGGHRVELNGEVFEGIEMKQLLTALLHVLPSHQKQVVSTSSTQTSFTMQPKNALCQGRVWNQLASFFKKDDLIIGEAGTSNISLTGITLPENATYITSNIWGSIGFSLPALLGTLLAAPTRRQLLFIGDGSFQLTAQELSTIEELKLAPIIFLINNGGYTIERYILGMHSEYNDVPNWKYHELPKTFDEKSKMKCFEVSTEDQLAEVLQELETCDSGAFVELHLDPYDAPEGLKKFGPATAVFDYGSKGPKNN